ncbi:MAG TPA: YceH family protein [Bryobacteraceae bacterium]|nr:YceH family protein [Bryobacteraceae bacterium]
MIPELDPVEARVLGALVEKEITTPEYYPLTLNALVNACNQKSNRDPVVSYEQDDVESALDRLRHKQLSTILTGGGNRVPKYGHRFQERLNLGRREVALICELLLRGPQTLGELRDRASRMHRFSDIEEVESVLNSLCEREPPFVRKLPKQAGMKESRYAHLLSGEVQVAEYSEPIQQRVSGGGERIADLEAQVEDLKDRVRLLEEQFSRFRAQFE